MYFDSLDRALATWVGDPNQERGHITSEIRGDPDWARYALDSEILLYTWLDRSMEGQRLDIKALVTHWQRLAELAKRTCQTHHCDGPERVVGEVGNTDEISIVELLSPQDKKR